MLMNVGREPMCLLIDLLIVIRLIEEWILLIDSLSPFNDFWPFGAGINSNESGRDEFRHDAINGTMHSTSNFREEAWSVFSQTATNAVFFTVFNTWSYSDGRGYQSNWIDACLRKLVWFSVCENLRDAAELTQCDINILHSFHIGVSEERKPIVAWLSTWMSAFSYYLMIFASVITKTCQSNLLHTCICTLKKIQLVISIIWMTSLLVP